MQKRVALDATSNGTEGLISVDGSGKALTLKYGGPALGGPRVYLIEEDGVNKNTMFLLKDQEFSFEVELSSLPCGFNAALYFVGMTENIGGAEQGCEFGVPDARVTRVPPIWGDAERAVSDPSPSQHCESCPLTVEQCRSAR